MIPWLQSSHTKNITEGALGGCGLGKAHINRGVCKGRRCSWKGRVMQQY